MTVWCCLSIGNLPLLGDCCFEKGTRSTAVTGVLCRFLICKRAREREYSVRLHPQAFVLSRQAMLNTWRCTEVGPSNADDTPMVHQYTNGSPMQCIQRHSCYLYLKTDHLFSNFQLAPTESTPTDARKCLTSYMLSMLTVLHWKLMRQFCTGFFSHWYPRKSPKYKKS